jgi:farnesyl diphosphate synthase
MKLPLFLTTYQTRINRVLDARLPSADTEPSSLHEAMRYCVLGGGKRLRAALVYATGEAFGAGQTLLDQAAAAVELAHAYSLVHDDLPAMDNDDLRHGRPSCHRVYGDAMAILVGDALQAFAFECLARSSACAAPVQQLLMLEVLARAIGSLGMVGGQALDISTDPESLAAHSQALDSMQQKKTGALIVASVKLGALAGDCQDPLQLQALHDFASKLGQAFQIRDDILDRESSTEVLGKTQGADSANNKAAYPAVFGLQAAKERAEALYSESLKSLAGINMQSATLAALAKFMLQREF